MQETKKCGHCGRELPLDRFIRRGQGYEAVCRECHASLGVGRRAGVVRSFGGSRYVPLSEYERVKQELEAVSAKLERIDLKGMGVRSYTPRELMDELYARGYRGELQYEVREVKTVTLGK